MTAEWVSKRLGHFIADDGKARPLMEPAEVLSFLGKDDENQIILPVTGAPWQIDSVSWYDSYRGYEDKTDFL